MKPRANRFEMILRTLTTEEGWARDAALSGIVDARRKLDALEAFLRSEDNEHGHDRAANMIRTVTEAWGLACRVAALRTARAVVMGSKL